MFYDDFRTRLLLGTHNLLASEHELGARQEALRRAIAVLSLSRESDYQKRGSGVDKETFFASWEPTVKEIGQLALKHWDSIGPASRCLSMLNAAEAAMADGSAAEGLRPHQVPILSEIVAMLQYGPSEVELPYWWPEDSDRFMLHGVSVEGATGIGKSAIMARILTALGMGRPPQVAHAGAAMRRPLRAVVVEPTQALVAQMAGNDSVFSRLLGGCKLGTFYQHGRQSTADVVVTTIDGFNECFRDGSLDGNPVDALVIDEGHHLTQRQFLTTLLKNWDGITIGFSATPGYRKNKDARHTLRRLVVGESRHYYQDQEVINGARAYTVVVFPRDVNETPDDVALMPAVERKRLRQLAVNQAVCELLAPLVESGRQCLVFCEPGDGNRHSIELAQALSARETTDGKAIVAGAIGCFQGSSGSQENQDMIQAFNNGAVHVLVTTAMAQEGMDLRNVDVVVMACKTTSVLKLVQIAGRGLRRSETFKSTILISLLTHGFGQTHFYGQTFNSVLDGDPVIRQGRILGKKDDTSRRARGTSSHDDDSAPPPFSAAGRELLSRLEARTIEDMIYGEGKEVSIPDGYLALSDIIAGTGVTEHNARYQLLRAGYRFVGRQEEVAGGSVAYVRYYEPAANTFYTADPKQPVDGVALLSRLRPFTRRSAVVTLDEVAASTGLSKRTIRSILTEDERNTSKLTRIPGALHARHWDTVCGEAIINRIKATLRVSVISVPLDCVARRVVVQPEAVRQLLARRGSEYGVHNIRVGDRRFTAVTWPGLEKLEARYGRRAGLPAIDFERVHSVYAQDPAPGAVEYAVEMLRMIGVPENRLPD